MARQQAESFDAIVVISAGKEGDNRAGEKREEDQGKTRIGKAPRQTDRPGLTPVCNLTKWAPGKLYRGAQWRRGIACGVSFPVCIEI